MHQVWTQPFPPPELGVGSEMFNWRLGWFWPGFQLPFRGSGAGGCHRICRPNDAWDRGAAPAGPIRQAATGRCGGARGPLGVVQSLVILTLANGTPVVAQEDIRCAFSRPLDGGMTFFDKRPLFGSSKTIRGIVTSIVATAAGAPIVGVEPEVGALMAAAAMAGDLFSSFVKRRCDLPPSSQALGLDQVPESLLHCWRGVGRSR